MHLPAVILSLVALIPFCQAAEIDRPAVKDSTILRSTTNCPQCPDQNCNRCTLGHEEILEANRGARAFMQSLIGFELPVPADQVTACSVQTPAFTKLPEIDIDVTVAAATSSDWDEDTVNGENAPDSGVYFNTVHVPALSNLPAFDVTEACKAADEDGQFSIYLAINTGSMAIWSKDSGNPAILHVTYEE